MAKRLIGRYYSWDEAREVMRNRNWKTTVEQSWIVKKGKGAKQWTVHSSPRKNYPPNVKKRKL